MYTPLCQSFSKMSSKLPLTREQIDAMKIEFLQLDADGDGKISTEEVEHALRSMRGKLRASESDIKSALRDIDKNGDGIINLKEYCINRRTKTNGDLIHRALVQRSRIRKEFARFDADNSGFISKEELLQVLRERGVASVSPDQMDELLKEADADNSGEIDYEEFVILMTK